MFDPSKTLEQNTWALIIARGIAPGDDNAERFAHRDMVEMARLFWSDTKEIDKIDFGPYLNLNRKNEIIALSGLYEYLDKINK